MDEKKTELFKSIREMDFSFFIKLKERADKASKELQFPETTLDHNEAIKFMGDHYSEENLTVIVKEWKDISENLAEGIIEWDQKLKDPEISIWLEEINSCILSVSMFEMKFKTLILNVMKYYGGKSKIFEKALEMIDGDLNKWDLYLKFKKDIIDKEAEFSDEAEHLCNIITNQKYKKDPNLPESIEDYTTIPLNDAELLFSEISGFKENSIKYEDNRNGSVYFIKKEWLKSVTTTPQPENDD